MTLDAIWGGAGRGGGHVMHMEKRTASGVLVKPLGIPRRRWEDNIKMNLRKRCAANCVRLSQDKDKLCAVVNTAMNHFVP